jgi:hypothetical protein
MAESTVIQYNEKDLETAPKESDDCYLPAYEPQESTAARRPRESRSVPRWKSFGILCTMIAVLLVILLLLATILFPIIIRSVLNVPPSQSDALAMKYCTTFYEKDLEDCLSNTSAIALLSMRQTSRNA